MNFKINGNDLEGIVRMEVGLLRQADRKGRVQTRLGTPEFQIERDISEPAFANISVFERFADVTAPDKVELEFTDAEGSVVEIELTDVMIDAPEVDYQTGRLVELIRGRAGTLEFVKPQGETYTRSTRVYPNSS